jgi:hypothetical protein
MAVKAIAHVQLLLSRKLGGDGQHLAGGEIYDWRDRVSCRDRASKNRFPRKTTANTRLEREFERRH